MIGNLLNIFKESGKSFEEQEKGETVVLLLRRHSFVLYLPLSTLGLFVLAPIFIFLAFYS